MLSSKDMMWAMRDGEMSIVPFSNEQLGTNSYDVCLGQDFFLLLSVDGCPQYFGPLQAAIGQKIYIPEGDTLLGRTIERIGTSGDIVARMKSRSTTRRTGISVCMDAGLGDVGYDNPWTCEFTAHARGGMRMTVGETFAQMVFERTDSPPLRPYSGQYNADAWPLCMIPAKYRDSVLPWSEIGRFRPDYATTEWVRD